MPTGLPSQASMYKQKCKLQQNFAVELMDMLELRKGSNVLDLGCGVGNVTIMLSEKVGAEGKVVAVDPDGERLKIARESYSASNIDYIQADDQTFPPGQYDVIFSNAVIHWIHDKETLFKRVYDNLCPGGCFAFNTPDSSFPIPEIGKLFFDKLVRPGFLHSFYYEKMTYLNESQCQKLASNLGFTKVSTSVTNTNLQWSSIDSYIEAMYGWSGGEFDPTKFEEGKLEILKEQ